MKVGFTGTREGMSQHQKQQFLLEFEKLEATEFHHGDCEGADAESHDIVREFFPNIWIVVHPPVSSYRRAYKIGDENRFPDEYLPRDERIVMETDVLIGAPLVDQEQPHSGTWYTIRFARGKTKPNIILTR